MTSMTELDVSTGNSESMSTEKSSLLSRSCHRSMFGTVSIGSLYLIVRSIAEFSMLRSKRRCKASDPKDKKCA